MSDETIVGIIPNAQKKAGFLKRAAYNLVVTNTRIIGARVTSEMLKKAVQEKSEESKAAGEGFFKRWAKTATAGFSFHEKYFSMNPEDIVKEHPDNFSVPIQEVKNIKYHQGDMEMNTNDSVEIVTQSGKHKFNLPSFSASQAKKILQEVVTI